MSADTEQVKLRSFKWTEAVLRFLFHPWTPIEDAPCYVSASWNQIHWFEFSQMPTVFVQDKWFGDMSVFIFLSFVIIFLHILNTYLLSLKNIIQSFHTLKCKSGNLTGNLLQIDFICITLVIATVGLRKRHRRENMMILPKQEIPDLEKYIKVLSMHSCFTDTFSNQVVLQKVWPPLCVLSIKGQCHNIKSALNLSCSIKCVCLLKKDLLQRAAWNQYSAARKPEL